MARIHKHNPATHAAPMSSTTTPRPFGRFWRRSIPSGFHISKIRKRINPTPVKVNFSRVPSFKTSQHPQKTRGTATNSSIMTSPGSRLESIPSATEQIGIASKASSMNPHNIKLAGIWDHSSSARKASAPAREPKVPGAGQQVPKGPNVASVSNNRFNVVSRTGGGGALVTSLPGP